MTLPSPVLPAVLLSALMALSAPAAPEKKPAPGESPAAPKVSLVEPGKLEQFLPSPPEGWKAQKVEKLQAEYDDGIHVTSVSRSYYSGEGDGEKDPIASITIIDSLKNADYFDIDEEEKWEMESKTEDGYDKRIYLDGMRVIEHYSKEARTGSLSIFVGQRFFVQIELSNEEPEKLYDWLKRIDLQRISSLK